MTDMTRRWTPEEDAIMREHYIRMGPTALYKSGMIDRTIRAMRDRSEVLKLRQGHPRGRRKTPAELKHGESIGIVCSVWELAKR